MKNTFIFLLLLFPALTGCTTASFEKNNIPDKIGGDSNTLILNYENRVKKYSRSIEDSHLKIYIEIEQPFIINNPELPDMKKIYSLAAIEGTAVFHVELDNKGVVVSSEKILSAGLGLDEVAEDIISQIKMEPSYLAGKPESTTIDIQIVFKMDDTE